MDDEDDLPQDWWKFDDCRMCQNRMDPDTCAECDNGEFFEEDEPAGVDTLIFA